MPIKKLLNILIFLNITLPLYANNIGARPTIVLVHGALLTSSIWAPLQSYLQNQHYNVVTLDVPGRSDDGIVAKEVTIDLAAKKVCDVIRMQNGPVMLVGHSQAGAVNNQAIDLCGDNIQTLVYIAAVVPLNGEKPYDLLSESDAANFDKCTKLDTENGLYQIDYTGPIKEMFMADASDIESSRAIANMVPEPIIIGENPLHFSNTRFESIPKFYIGTTQDKIISPATQKKFLERVKFVQTYFLETSHSPFLTQPQQIGRILVKIASKTVVAI